MQKFNLILTHMYIHTYTHMGGIEISLRMLLLCSIQVEFTSKEYRISKDLNLFSTLPCQYNTWDMLEHITAIDQYR